MEKELALIIFVITLIVGFYFAFILVDTKLTLSKNWATYINPFNQLFLFVGGMLIGDLFYYGRFKNLNWPNYLFFIFLIIFTFYPVYGDRVNIISNINRFVFSFCSFLIVISFLKTKITLTQGVSLPFKVLGDISYTLYLLHPLVYYTLLKHTLLPQSKELSFVLCVIVTLCFSILIYHFIEKPFMKFGRK